MTPIPFDAQKFLDCLAELNALTRLQRTGWVLAGVRDPESVSDHCFETAVCAILLASTLGKQVDLGKVAIMALFHEVGEARLTDLPRRSKPYVKAFKKMAEAGAAKDILGPFSNVILPLLDEMHDGTSDEAKLVEAAEELQIIFRAALYAKESNGDISEYRNDVAAYDSQGVEAAKQVADKIGSLLESYLSGKPYWKLGYSTSE